jgi:hypothetical protein
MRVRNPITGRMILKNGRTYKQLVEEGHIDDKSVAKYDVSHWVGVSPSKRRSMVQQCPKCFALEGTNKFPICRSCQKGPDCLGLRAAYVRARQQRKMYPGLAEKIRKLQREYKCT